MATSSKPPVTQTKRTRLSVEIVAETLEGYAQRGVFRGFSRESQRGEKAMFRMLWHRDRIFELMFDAQKNSLRFPLLLPNVSAEMFQRLKEFIQQRASEDLPEHRRIDRRKVELRAQNRKGNVSLSLMVKDRDVEYGARKLIHLVHEIFLTFLMDGRNYDYMVENFDLDPDAL
jgi:hypothetical protein